MHFTPKLAALLALALASPLALAKHKVPYEITVQRYSGQDCPKYWEIPIPSERKYPAAGFIVREDKCKTFNPNDTPFQGYSYTQAGRLIENGECSVTAYTGAKCTGEELQVDAKDGAQGCHNLDPGMLGRSMKVTCKTT